MSLAVPIRFCSRFLATLMLHLSSSIACAGEDDFFLKEIMKEQQPNLNQQLPDWLKTQPATLSPVFEKLLREGNNGSQFNKEGVVNIEKSQSPGKPIQGRWIFVSMGMPTQELKAAALEASTTNSVLVFRGVEKGGDTGTITRRLYQVVKDIKPVPGAVIDPTLFTRFNVQAVPTMI